MINTSNKQKNYNYSFFNDGSKHLNSIDEKTSYLVIQTVVLLERATGR